MTSTLTTSLSPLQFKGEVMDFDVDFDGDHRKRRRNRTTQSCLNCHTSKRKCDRKRPCQRCIQLGLTGLCVYEVDDMTSRDDPTVDESTRLRNRIAELESLVRELRGKPHPKWADASFCEGDPNGKWHSRSSRRGISTPGTTLGSPVMREGHSSDTSQQMYRFPSTNSSPYSNSGHVLPPTFSRGRHEQCSPTDEVAYTTSSSPTSTIGYVEPHHSGPSANASPSGHYRYHPYRVAMTHSHVHSSCSCLTNPAAGHSLITLTNQLRNALNVLRQLPEHNTHSQQCAVLKRVAELDDLLHGSHAGGIGGGGYDGIPTPPEGEMLSPISPSSHSGMGSSLQDWPSMSNTGGYEYFSVQSGEHAAYPKTYQMH